MDVVYIITFSSYVLDLCYDSRMNERYDVIVIGGGAAGMMSAGVAAAAGRKVLLLEKNSNLGKKLRITGGGRCNITNNTPDTRTLLKKYGTAEQFLFSAFSQYGVEATLTFFHSLGLTTKVEAENRVFPESERAEDVAVTLEKFLKQKRVTVLTNVTVKKILTENGQITGVRTSEGILSANSYILATGGTSRPDTGSTGDGYTWLREIGHAVTTPTPSLVPIEVKDTWVTSVAGVSIADTQISLYQNDVPFLKTTGKILFTHNGLSGPGILNISQQIGDTLAHGPVEVRINTLPAHNEEAILEFLRALHTDHANKMIKNILSELVPTSLVLPILNQAAIKPNRLVNTITRQERHVLIASIRGLTLQVKRLLGPEKAIIASGGVALPEIDFKTMSSRHYPNLFIVGDLLDINRPSGGYSLQLCWTTGYLAGSNC